MTDIPGALASLKGAADIVKILYGAKLSADVQEKVSNLQQLIFDARESAFNAQEELSVVKGKVADLERQISEHETWLEDKKRYQLFKPDNVSSVVYGLKEAASTGEPAHYLCTNCYQQRRKAILNNHPNANGFTVFLCPICKCQIPTGYRGRVEAKFAPG